MNLARKPAILGALLLAAALFAGRPVHADLVGAEVLVHSEFPSRLVDNLATAKVDASATEFDCFADPTSKPCELITLGTMDFAASSITIELLEDNFAPAPEFNGWMFFFPNGPDILDATLTTSELVGTPAMDFNSRSLSLNMNGVQILGGTIVVDLTLAAGGRAPEPGTLFLLGGALIGGHFVRRKRDL